MSLCSNYQKLTGKTAISAKSDNKFKPHILNSNITSKN